MLSIAKSIYPLPELPKATKRSRPMRVLCLGLPRSGTDSLHNALEILGLSGVFHGYEWWMNPPNTSMLYCELIQLKLQNRLPSSEILRERYFDRLLADKEALTDIPPAWFAPELLQAYPEAKVILNRRRDVQAWKCSFRDSILPMMQSWKYWLASWFEAELFWGVWLTRLGHDRFLFKGDFEANAEKAYIGHYENLENILEAEGRAYLDWSVEDDWAPLCEFLDLAQPDVPFPRGNTAPEFIPKLLTVDDARFRKATTNFFIVTTGLVGAMSLYLWG